MLWRDGEWLVKLAGRVYVLLEWMEEREECEKGRLEGRMGLVSSVFDVARRGPSRTRKGKRERGGQ